MSAVTSLIVIVVIAVALYAVIRFNRTDDDSPVDESSRKNIPDDAP